MHVIVVGSLKFFGSVLWAGARQGVQWTPRLVGVWLGYLVWLLLVVWGPRWNLAYLIHLVGSVFGHGYFGIWLEKYIAKWVQFFFFFCGPFGLWLFVRGIKGWIESKKYQRLLNYMGIKSNDGKVPQFLKLIPLENTQRRILVQAQGVDIASFESKKGVLESSFNAIVQEIKHSPSSRQVIEIKLADKELSKLVPFEAQAGRLVKPYTFLVGDSLNEFVVADLCEIHHMLVAGSTGNGKSVFFKQALIGLLRSSKHIQMYLIDLKRGVEMKPFEPLSNVYVAKDEPTAVNVLSAVVQEMNRRFEYLERKKLNEIDPERDKMDRIVVAVDEASELFTIVKSSSEMKAFAQTARDQADKIAKLGRAAAIHLILATQKVTRETIDTRVQSNINAKMCLRVNTLGASTTVLGSNKAYLLPEIKGRGIWSVGSRDVLIQVPFMTNNEIADAVDDLTEKFNGEQPATLSPMLQIGAAPKEKGNYYEADAPPASATDSKVDP